MRPEPVFRRYDIRGNYPEEIDEEFAELLGKAIGTVSLEDGSHRVVACRDNKQSSEKLKQALIKGLKSTGVTILDPGVGPTDYAAFTGNWHNAVSVEVTSSHLPLDTNGFKIMYPEGNGFVNKDLDRVKTVFRQKEFEQGNGVLRGIEEAAGQNYRSELKRIFKKHLDGIDRKIVLETMGGAGSIFLPELLEELGAEVIDLDTEKEGPYVDPPEPRRENLQHVEQRVAEEDADMGIATDMDADRAALYYKGEWLDDNDVFAMFIELLKPGKTVASVDTSGRVEELAKNYGEIAYTRVGDPFVIQKMIDNKAELSGEPNGHYCFPEFVAYNSGSLAALLLAGSDIEQLKSSIPGYFTLRDTITVENKEKSMKQFKEAVEQDCEIISETDGVKFAHDKAEVLVRSSGSSHKLRFIADSRDKSSAEEALEYAVELARNP